LEINIYTPRIARIMHPIITIQDSRDKDLFSLVSMDSYFDTVSSVFVAGTCFILAVFPSLRGDLAALTFAIEEVIAFSVRADTRCASSVAWSDVRFLPSFRALSKPGLFFEGATGFASLF
jgi:hypothetical protein